MDRHHSTLELVKFDESARAPERDKDATAFELDTSALAPQVVLDTTPEVFYDSSLPEANNIEESTKERAPSPLTPKPALKRSLMIIVLVVAAGIAIGVGVGIWHRRDHAPHGSSATTSPPAPRPTMPHHPATTSSPNITSTAQFILNDTSLSALLLPSGDRHLFFQDNNGSIRRVIRLASENQWTIGPSFNLSSNPKKHTPLAANIYNPDEQLVTGEDSRSTIWLQYVSESHTLVSGEVSGDFWTPYTSLGNLSTAVDTRSLSVFSLPETNSTNSSMLSLALLLYENPTGKVSALLLRGINPRVVRGDFDKLSGWIDVTSQESKLLPGALRNGPGSNNSYSTTLYESDTNVTFSTPFLCTGNKTASAVEMLFHSPDRSPPIVVTRYKIDSDGLGRFDTSVDNVIDPDGGNGYGSILRSDMAAFSPRYLIWINGTQPVVDTVDGGLAPRAPKTSFPFARLAYSKLESNTHIYHQINGTTFAEEQWDEIELAWTTTNYIHVLES